MSVLMIEQLIDVTKENDWLLELKDQLYLTDDILSWIETAQTTK
jgi:hypothetical protein